MDDQFDLPVLERVKSTSDASPRTIFAVVMLVLLLGALVIIAVISWPRKSIGQVETVIAAACVLAIGVVIWWTGRSSGFDGNWETSPDGLKVTGFLRSRMIPWAFVLGAKTQRLGMSGKGYRIESNRGSTVVATKNPFLIASLRQHLKRIGKADAIELPPEALMLWFPIPASIPRETDWVNPSPPRLITDVAMAAVGIGILAVAAVFLIRTSRSFLSIAKDILMAILGGAIARPWHNMFIARKTSVRGSYLESVVYGGLVMLLWDEIESVQWKDKALVLRATKRRRVRIPWNAKDKDATQTILAIVRRLRTVDKPIQIPVPYELIEAYHNDIGNDGTTPTPPPRLPRLLAGFRVPT